MGQSRLGLQGCLNMKKILFGFLLVFIHSAVMGVPATVIKIIDGDTFLAKVALSDKINVLTISVRLRNVDTPEIHGMCDEEIKMALQAKQRLAELIPEGTIVEIDNVTNDKYQGRIDASVYDSKKRDVGKILIKEKLGRPYSGGKREPWCKNIAK